MSALVWPGFWTLRRERGQDMAEYAVLLGFVAVIVIVGIMWLGRVISVTLYNRLSVDLLGALL